MRSKSAAFLLEDTQSVPDSALNAAEQSLSPLDRERFRSFKSLERKRQFLCGRLLLNLGLLEKTGLYLSFTTSEDGSPQCSDPSIHCSLSHSGNLVAACFSFANRIGIDIELKRDHRFEEIVSNFFHPTELAVFQNLSDDQVSDWFYNTWTRKEAVAKYLATEITSTLILTEAESLQQCHLSYIQSEEYALCIAHNVLASPEFSTLAFAHNTLKSSHFQWIENSITLYAKNKTAGTLEIA